MHHIVVRLLHYLLLCIAMLTMSPLAVAREKTSRVFTVQLTARSGSTEISLGLGRPLPFDAAIDGRGDGKITIDFKGLTLNPDRSMTRGVGLVRAYHAEAIAGGGVRLIVDLAHPAIITRSRSLAATADKPPRAVIELASSTAKAMRAAAEAYDAEPGMVSGQGAKGGDLIGALIEPVVRGEPILPVAPPLTPAPASGLSAAEHPRGSIALHVGAVPSPLPVLISGSKAPPSVVPATAPKRVIVIDAGHGGIDPGAESVAGYHEKEITLATARLLRRALEATGHYRVVMTRDSDVYLKLRERVARARAAHGNLFISLHADSVAASSDRTTRGASIYTLSETASDAESDRIAQQENRADAIGGVDLGDQADDVAGILVDLTVRETVNDGNRLARMMTEALTSKGVALLPNSPHRSAGFAVLKSPEIPSILIEMGYLSDISDSRALADARHQGQIASAIAAGVDRYFAWLQGLHS